MPGFWICFRYLNTSGFWIYHGSMPGLHRVPNIPEYGWIIPGYAWLYLNLPRSEWMAFVLHLLIVLPYLKETIDCFLLFLFFVFDWIFLQVRFQIYSYLWGATLYPMNIYDAFLIIYLPILLLFFFHFLLLQRT